MLMASSLTLLVFHSGKTCYLMVFTSRDGLDVRLMMTANLLKRQDLEKVLSGLAVGYDRHTPMTCRVVSDN